VSLLSHAACTSMSTTTSTTTRDRGDRYGPIEWAQSQSLCRQQHPVNDPFSGQPVPDRWILLKQETVSGSGIIGTICKSAPCTRHITMTSSHHPDFFYRLNSFPNDQPTASKHCKAHHYVDPLEYFCLRHKLCRQFST